METVAEHTPVGARTLLGDAYARLGRHSSTTGREQVKRAYEKAIEILSTCGSDAAEELADCTNLPEKSEHGRND